uniref:Uncharacterized protein n=1 Tax=Chlamydomonas leiostraca TaxID=1034604 RepID=A0A7S0R758_9CHLO
MGDEEDEEVENDTELAGLGLNGSPIDDPSGSGAAASSAAVQQQLQAGITAVVAAVTHEGANRGQEAEEEAAGVGSGGGAMDVDGVLGGRTSAPVPAADMSAAARGGSLDVAPPGSRGSRGVAGSSQSEIEAAGSSEGGFAFPVPPARISAPGALNMARDGPNGSDAAAGTSGGAASAGVAAAAGTRAARTPSTGPLKQLYPAGRVLHFFPLHALERRAAPAAAGAGAGSTAGAVAASIAGAGPARDKSRPSSLAEAVTTMARAGAAASTGNQEAAVRAATAPGPDGLLPATVQPAPGQQWALYRITNHQAYGRIQLCKTMVMDHFVFSYLQALDSVMDQLQTMADKPPHSP